MSLVSYASIVTVGTELTTGQVTNRNAAWLSSQLVPLGIDVVLQITVADDRKQIEEALSYSFNKAGLILVTGGLGPTTDDFTREVIASWLGLPLEFHASIWEQIQHRLTRYHLPVAVSNRQQAYFPKGAQILPNPEGTAAGFRLPVLKDSSNPSHSSEGWLWALPGPPREIAALWPQVSAQIQADRPKAPKLKLLTWSCIGKSEAELGEWTEAIFQGSGIKTGYRAHRPYVEIKVWCLEDQLEKMQPYFEALEQKIKPWLVVSQGEDLANRFLEAISGLSSVYIYDAATQGILGERLGTSLREYGAKESQEADGRKPGLSDIHYCADWAQISDPKDWVEGLLRGAAEKAVVFVVGGWLKGNLAYLGFKKAGQSRLEVFESHWKLSELMDRSRRELTEVALKQWCQWLASAS